MDHSGANGYYDEDDQMLKIVQLQKQMEQMQQIMELQQQMMQMQKQLDEQAAKIQRAKSRANYNPIFDQWGIDYCENWSRPYASHVWTQRSDKEEEAVVGINSRMEVPETQWNQISQAVESDIHYDNPLFTQNEGDEEDEPITTDILSIEDVKYEEETIVEQSVISEGVKNPQVKKPNSVEEVDLSREVGAYCDPFLLPSKAARENVSEKVGADQPQGPKIEWSIFSKRQRYNSLGMTYIFPTAMFVPLSAAKIDKLRRTWRRDKST